MRKILAMVATLILCVVLFSGCGKSAEETFAEKYFEAILAEDWETIYDMTDFNNSPFVTKEKFVKGMMREGSKYARMDIGAYEASEVGYEKKGGELKEYTGSDIYINYTFKESKAVDCTGFTLIETENGYKTTESFGCVDNFNVLAPRLATVSIDGTEITDEYLVTENRNKDMYEYDVPIVFGENITLKAYGDEIEDFEFMVDTGDFKTFTFANLLRIKEEEQKKYIQRALEDRQKIIEGYVNNLPFDELDVKFTTAQSDLNRLEIWYDSAIKATYKKTGYGIKERRIDEIIDGFYTNAKIDSNGHIMCNLECRVYDVIVKNNGEEEIRAGVKRSSQLTYVYGGNGEYLLAHESQQMW